MAESMNKKIVLKLKYQRIVSDYTKDPKIENRLAYLTAAYKLKKLENEK